MERPFRNTGGGGVWKSIVGTSSSDCDPRFLLMVNPDSTKTWNGNVSKYIGGEEKHTLTLSEMPSHNHTQDPTTYVDFNCSRYINDNGNMRWLNTKSHDSYSGITASTGGGQPHNNMPPYITVYCWTRVE